MKKVFISYSHDTDEHCIRVRELANKLRRDGIKVVIDTDMLPGGPEEGWPMWSEAQVKNADQVLVVCTKTYHRRYEGEEKQNSGQGSACEARAIRQLVYNETGNNEKFRVILFTQHDTQNIPLNLQSYHHFPLYNLDVYQQLLQWLQPLTTQTQREAEFVWLKILEKKLNSLYTPLQGESRQSQENKVHIPSQMVQHSLLEHLARKVAKDLPEKTQEYEDIQSAFSEVSRAVLIGEPGAGKSTTLRKLAGDQVEQAKKDINAAIPLFISLGEWRDADQPFSAYLQQQMGVLGPYLQTLLQQNHVILLLDGLNETPTKLRENKAQQLKHWLQQQDHRQLLCYVSCRDLDYTPAMDLELDTIRIRPLDPPRIRAFLQEYLPLMMGEPGKKAAQDLFWALGGGEPLRKTWEAWQRAGATDQQFWDSTDIPRKAPDVFNKTTATHDKIWRNAVHNRHSLLKLAVNPFMLSMLAVVYTMNESLPKNRAGLFTKFVDTLLERENLLDQQNRILSDLQSLAWAMQQQRDNHNSSVQTTLPRSQALKYVDEQLLLRAARANLLDAGDDVRFSHQLLQEYFTALMMREKLEKNKLDANKLWPADQFWKPSGWEEATVLLAGLYEPDCSAVLNW